jgi:hypothetical protein
MLAMWIISREVGESHAGLIPAKREHQDVNKLDKDCDIFGVGQSTKVSQYCNDPTVLFKMAIRVPRSLAEIQAEKAKAVGAVEPPTNLTVPLVSIAAAIPGGTLASPSIVRIRRQNGDLREWVCSSDEYQTTLVQIKDSSKMSDLNGYINHDKAVDNDCKKLENLTQSVPLEMNTVTNAPLETTVAVAPPSSQTPICEQKASHNHASEAGSQAYDPFETSSSPASSHEAEMETRYALHYSGAF